MGAHGDIARALAESDESLRALVAQVPAAVYRSSWDEDYRLVLISDEVERITGRPVADFISGAVRFRDIIHPEDRPGVHAAVMGAIEEGEAFNLEYRVVRPDGQVRQVTDRGRLVSTPGGRFMDGLIFDVTERVRAEEAMRAAAVTQARLDAVSASRARVIEAADAARRRIERDLHDGAQQELVTLALLLRHAKLRLQDDPGQAGQLLDEAGADLSRALESLRELARGIHPAVLTDRGLGAAVQALVNKAVVPVELELDGLERYEPALEAAAYFSINEALTNVAKYADASHASVRLAQRGDTLVVEVRDDGRGGADPTKGSGLTGLADRVGSVNGRLSVESPPGGGTLVRLELPL